MGRPLPLIIMATKLSSLPYRVVRELCNYLNVEGTGVGNWKDLISLVKDHPYSVPNVASISLIGLMRPYSSPADEVMSDFIARGISVDQLYCMLAEMHAEGAMTVLENHVTSAVVTRVKQHKEEERVNANLGLYLGSHDSKATTPDSTPSPDEHPKYGVLPSHPPPIPMGTSNKGNQVSNYVSPSPSSPPPSSPPSLLSSSSSSGYLLNDAHSPVVPPPWPVGHHYPHIPQGHDNSRPPLIHNEDVSLTTSSSTTTTSTNVTTTSSNSSNILHFSYSELSDTTECFTEGMLGIGAFGTVFKAEIRGNGPYAIKKLHTESEMGVHCGLFYESFHRETFSQELQLLTRYHHRNILSLVAHSNDGYSPCLVYEYMENGSLAECLQGKRGVCLGWELRVAIATQIADALHFLHTVNSPTCLVHGDIKSANILLDVHFIPKLSDFGLARELTSRNSKSTVSTSRSNIVMGTMAYMAPEFMRNKKLTTRTDVYAFGVVMLELYTGEPAYTDDPSVKDKVLTDRLSDLLEDSEEHIDEVLMSADLNAHWPQETALGLFDIITVCLQNSGRKRLPIKQVMDQLSMIPK